jgi:hypothetical protein
MRCGEQLPRHLGPYPGPLGGRDWPVRRQPGLLVARGDPLRDLNTKPAWFDVDNLERHPEPSRRLDVGVGQISVAELFQPLRRQWMHPRREQSSHLLAGHRIPGRQSLNAHQAGADPHSRALAPLGVVGGEPDMTLRGGIQRRHLPGQIVVPRPSSELMNAHRHNPHKRQRRCRRSAAAVPCKRCIQHRTLRLRWGYV